MISIGLWGRSMGASTSILYASKDPEIVALCLDSPFANLTDLANDIMNGKVRAIRTKIKFRLLVFSLDGSSSVQPRSTSRKKQVSISSNHNFFFST